MFSDGVLDAVGGRRVHAYRCAECWQFHLGHETSCSAEEGWPDEP